MSKSDHSGYDCFACAILTHGGNGDILYARDEKMKLTDFTRPFCADVCGTLAGKPKLFFIQVGFLSIIVSLARLFILRHTRLMLAWRKSSKTRLKFWILKILQILQNKMQLLIRLFLLWFNVLLRHLNAIFFLNVRKNWPFRLQWPQIFRSYAHFDTCPKAALDSSGHPAVTSYHCITFFDNCSFF